MGRAAFFIRLFGCPLHCPFCDSAGTWHPDYIPAKIERFTVEQLLSEAIDSGCCLVVITGGEPAIHDLTQLTKALCNSGFEVAIETSGSFPLRGSFDHITVSPKSAKPALKEVLEQTTELKFIIEKPDDIESWILAVRGLLEMGEGQSISNFFGAIWLHPEWSQRENPAVLNGITKAVGRYGDPVRAGYQMHKLYRADLLDNRSAPSVPLGGRTERNEKAAVV